MLVSRNKAYQFDTSSPTNVSNQETKNKQKNVSDEVVDVVLNDDVKHLVLHGNPSKNPITESALDRLQEASYKSLKKFESTSRLSVSFEDTRFYFTDLDLEEDRMIGTFGLSGPSGESLAMLATDMNVNERMVKEYIKDYADEFPSLRRKSVQWDAKPQTFGAIKDSGLADATVWRGSSPDGLVHVAVWIPREDKKGHYAFIYSTPNVQDLENDGFFDNLYAKLKALPEQ
ncbi:MAG: hypothetical protein M9899_05580 [Bdellovibrionaceae bacterium]|nr:hypothetical protein [Pseudobdellovibrionaceae bacterium]